MNTPLKDHPLVGYVYTYHQNLPPFKDYGELDVIVGNGMQVQVKSLFQNWNDVEGLDMLYVYVPATGMCTHIPPRAIGLGPIHAEGMHPLNLDWEDESLGMGDCAWWDLPTSERPDWARFDCWGRAAKAGNSRYSVLCEGHHNRRAPGH